jgi:hypothetical protein
LNQVVGYDILLVTVSRYSIGVPPYVPVRLRCHVAISSTEKQRIGGGVAGESGTKPTTGGVTALPHPVKKAAVIREERIR